MRVFLCATSQERHKKGDRHEKFRLNDSGHGICRLGLDECEAGDPLTRPDPANVHVGGGLDLRYDGQQGGSQGAPG